MTNNTYIGEIHFIMINQLILLTLHFTNILIRKMIATPCQSIRARIISYVSHGPYTPVGPICCVFLGETHNYQIDTKSSSIIYIYIQKGGVVGEGVTGESR